MSRLILTFEDLDKIIRKNIPKKHRKGLKQHIKNSFLENKTLVQKSVVTVGIDDKSFLLQDSHLPYSVLFIEWKEDDIPEEQMNTFFEDLLGVIAYHTDEDHWYSFYNYGYGGYFLQNYLVDELYSTQQLNHLVNRMVTDESQRVALTEYFSTQLINKYTRKDEEGNIVYLDVRKENIFEVSLNNFPFDDRILNLFLEDINFKLHQYFGLYFIQSSQSYQLVNTYLFMSDETTFKLYANVTRTGGMFDYFYVYYLRLYLNSNQLCIPSIYRSFQEMINQVCLIDSQIQQRQVTPFLPMGFIDYFQSIKKFNCNLYYYLLLLFCYQLKNNGSKLENNFIYISDTKPYDINLQLYKTDSFCQEERQFTYYATPININFRNMGHRNLLFFDLENGVVHRFEPYGTDTDSVFLLPEAEKKLNKALTKFLMINPFLGQNFNIFHQKRFV
jgi:hypothetical protein